MLTTLTLPNERDHIRQLLYIVLRNPSFHAQGNEKLAQGADVAPTKQYTHLPSLTDVAAAQRCLQAFAETNSPRALLRAIPSYDVSNISLSDGANAVEEEEESFLSREARRIQSCRDCWQLLRAEFVQSISEDASLPVDGRTRHRTTNSSLSDDDISSTAVVCPTAWPVLEWLVSMFEKDEQITEARGQCKHPLCFIIALAHLETGMIGSSFFSIFVVPYTPCQDKIWRKGRFFGAYGRRILLPRSRRPFSAVTRVTPSSTGTTNSLFLLRYPPDTYIRWSISRPQAW